MSQAAFIRNNVEKIQTILVTYTILVRPLGAVDSDTIYHLEICLNDREILCASFRSIWGHTVETVVNIQQEYDSLTPI